jgi:hypothetical protein
MMRARSTWRRVGLALASLSLALFALVVVPHVHAAADNPTSCPIWAAHGPAGAAVETPEVALAAFDYGVASSDPIPSHSAPPTRAAHPFSARAPPAFVA